MSKGLQAAEWSVGKHSSSTVWMLSCLIVLAAIATGSVLYLFDPRNYGFYPTCLFHRTTGLLCPGCGSLRALHQLLHGHLSTALQYNPMLLTALVLLVLFGSMNLIAWLRDKRLGFVLSRKWLLLIVAVGLVVSIWRNIPGSPFAMPSF